MTDWIVELCRSFAKRLVQEAAMQETNWFVAHPEVTRYILQHEQAQELIGRMGAAPLVIQYDERDEIIHTDGRPFCEDKTCPCHCLEMMTEYIEHPILEGLLTGDEAARLWLGEQL